MSKPEPIDKPSARDRILAAANELFYQEGIRAIGIDTVIEKAGVAKMSLYRAFPSKDDLIAAFLGMRDGLYWEWWDGVVARHPDDPRQQLTDLFLALAKRTSSPSYRGCPFVNMAVEFPDHGHPGRAVAEANKCELRRRMRGLVDGLGVTSPALLTDQLLLLMEGAYSAGNSLSSNGSSTAVASAAEALISSHLRENCP
ncbi:MAG: TetR/AcrR family transcriptional regulator [Phaeospirillum sp.]|nr:TetR/AcrR family transcriptional regulator [Phaeospirillum sp.]